MPDAVIASPDHGAVDVGLPDAIGPGAKPVVLAVDPDRPGNIGEAHQTMAVRALVAQARIDP